MLALFWGFAVAVVLLLLFSSTDDVKLKQTVKTWIGFALLGVIALVVFGFLLIRFFPALFCGLVIFLALRWMLSPVPVKCVPPHLTKRPKKKQVQTGLDRTWGPRMQQIRRQRL